MLKINYKATYILIYTLLIVSILFTLKYTFDKKNLTDINAISQTKYLDKLNDFENQLYTFIYEHKRSLIALRENKSLIQYINHKNNKEIVEDIFLTVKKTLSSSMQIRLIDLNGNEEINVGGKTFNLKNEKKSHFKLDKYYFKSFLKLKKNEIGLSNIDLAKQNGKALNPKTILLKLASPLYDENNIKRALLVLNINLDTLIKQISNTTLYHVQLVDKYKRFILHPDLKRGLTSNTFDTYLLENEFGSIATKKILEQKEFFGENFYSKKLLGINNQQELTLILKAKFDNLYKKKKENELVMYTTLIFSSLLFLPLVIYLAKTPEKLRGRINQQVITDSLTNLPNKEYLFKDINASNFKKSIIILIHLDNYEKIQNAYGYKVSDNLLIACSTFLRGFESTNNFIKLYKISNNTFAFKYKFSNIHSLYKSLEDLHHKVENHSFVLLDNIDVLINCTIGTSNPMVLTNNVNELKEAENALEKALKEKIDINVYDEDLNKNIELNKQNIIMVNNLKKALESDNIIIEFQPIYNNKKNVIDKYETLIRMNIEGEVVYPDKFLQMSKDIKKYRRLTQIVINKSFEYFKDKDVGFSINLSIEDISNKYIRSHLFEQIKKYNVQDRLVLEIVESEAVSNYDNFYNFIKEIKKLGCKIAIDDFGSGYSNYEYIINLNEYIDYLKIDGSLIIDIHKNPKRQLLIGTLKFLCDNLEIKTIAEYVENKELFDYVKSMGIDYSQGYYIGKSKSEIITQKL